MNPDETTRDVVIVGVGLSGLACAIRLVEFGWDVTVLERSGSPGGRVRTDRVDGFRLDRGFQVILTEYPTLREMVGPEALDLRHFHPGALVRVGGRFHRVSDPLRRPGALLDSMLAPVGTLRDKLRILTLRRTLSSMSVAQILARPEVQTRQAMTERWGFGPEMTTRFLMPFLGGITFDPELTVSSRFFEFVMKMFSAGYAAVPALGMQRLPERLAAGLPADSLVYHAEVGRLEPGRIHLTDGRSVDARAIVLAAGPGSALVHAARADRPTLSSTTVYFSAPRSPVDGPWLLLDGDGSGPVTNLAVMSDVAPDYAPAGTALVAASMPGSPEDDDQRLVQKIRRQMTDWFGLEADSWTPIRVYRIEHALPNQSPSAGGVAARPERLDNGLFICGDHREHGSLEGALVSGRRTAAAVHETLSLQLES